MSEQDIRPDYYQSCGYVGRSIFLGWPTEELLNTECQIVARQLGNDADLFQVLKYLWRAGKKGDDADTKKDLLKARFYLKQYIQNNRFVADTALFSRFIFRIEGLIKEYS